MHRDYEKRESSQTAIERLTSSDNTMNNLPLLIFRCVLQRISHTGPPGDMGKDVYFSIICESKIHL